MKKKIGFTVPLMMTIFLVFIGTVTGLDKDRQKEGKHQLEEVIRRTAVTCYASEGFYPPNLEYMIDQYGLQYDKEQYIVYYEMFASNLMPEITVLEK